MIWPNGIVKIRFLFHIHNSGLLSRFVLNTFDTVRSDKDTTLFLMRQQSFYLFFTIHFGETKSGSSKFVCSNTVLATP